MGQTSLHGGDLDEISRIYGIEKSKIINFGGNVNPLGLPESVRKAIAGSVDIAAGYPDVSYAALRAAISRYTGAKAEHITVGNGSTELITGFIKAVMPKKSVIISPAYSEYLRILEQIGCDVVLYPLDEKNGFIPDIDALPIDDGTDMLVFCNPNNPTGTYFTAAETQLLAERCKKHGCFIMTDETYVEFSDPEKHISAVELTDEYDNIAVVRGTSKFFACPGLRLGYGITGSKEVMERVNSGKDLWSVNVFADLAGQIMFDDTEFAKRTVELINTERNRLYAELGEIKALKLYDTQSNFILARIVDGKTTSREVFLTLIKKHLLVRDAENFPFLDDTYFRFCILGHDENTMLIKALKEIFK